MGDEVACPVCEKREIHLLFMTLQDVDRHHNEHHKETPVQWGCSKCDKSFPKLHGAQCHIPKCWDPTVGREGQVKCDACLRCFGSQRGLSTHERHAHPAVRNIKRRGTDPPPINVASGRVWKADKVALLKELDVIYEDHKFPNVEISKILTTKTAEQIRNKRKALKIANTEGDFQEEASATEGGCDLTEPSVASAGQEISVNSEVAVHEWRQCLINEIERQAEVPHVLRDVYTRLRKSWAEGKNNSFELKRQIDYFICTILYGALKSKNNKKDKPLDKNKIIYHRQDGRKKSNRNRRRRYSYARCQETFNECPRMLADAIVNNDLAYLEPTRIPPDALDVKQLYEALWRRTGPTNLVLRRATLT